MHKFFISLRVIRVIRVIRDQLEGILPGGNRVVLGFISLRVRIIRDQLEIIILGFLGDRLEVLVVRLEKLLWVIGRREIVDGDGWKGLVVFYIVWRW